MRIGVPTEIKNNENRVALTPAGADRLVHEGHRVLVQSGAGLGSRITDEAYLAAGAEIVSSAEEAWGEADLLLKVKEPIAQEYGFLRPELTLFTYLHLAADRALTGALVDAGTTAVAYETVQLPDRSLPLLVPMSEIAGRLSVTVGSYSLMRSNGGRGTLLGGIAGTPRAKTVVIGGGVAGEHAAANALGLGSKVTVFDISLPRLRELEHRYGGALRWRHPPRLQPRFLALRRQLPGRPPRHRSARRGTGRLGPPAGHHLRHTDRARRAGRPGARGQSHPRLRPSSPRPARPPRAEPGRRR